MERRSFFRKLGIGAAAVVVAPKIIEAVNEHEEVQLIPHNWYNDLSEISDSEWRVTTKDDFDELESWQPHFVETTTEPRDIGGGVYEIGFSEVVCNGRNIVIPKKFTNSEFGFSCLVVGNVSSWIPNNDKLIYRIACFGSKQKIANIPIGTKLFLGASAYQEPEFITRNFETRSGQKWTITELKEFSNV